jgi:hypothetical protein
MKYMDCAEREQSKTRHQANEYIRTSKNRLYKNYNVTALTITPDDGPMRPKHVVAE